MMWYGVLGTKEVLHRTYKNLEQRVLLEVRHCRLPFMLHSHRCHCHFTNIITDLICCQCDGRPIPLPSLQGIAVLNIPSYGGGTNFWGGTKEDEVRTKPVCLSDYFLFVGLTVLPLSRRPSQHLPLMIRSWRWWQCLAAYRWLCHESLTCSTTASHRYTRLSDCLSMGVSVQLYDPAFSLPQCRTVKITILGDEGVPVQVDGEAWIQPPGYIKIIHKNRTQTLTRDRVSSEPWHWEQTQCPAWHSVWLCVCVCVFQAFESTLKSWEDKQKCEFPRNPQAQSSLSAQPEVVSEEEASLINEFGQAAGALIHR